MDTDAHWENVCLPPGCAMASWNAVMEVMRRAAGDIHTHKKMDYNIRHTHILSKRAPD
jgi:hypothetical protein